MALLAAPVFAAEDVHVVQPGETLWEIAADLTGAGSRWHEIYRANRDQIKDPSRLYPGQRLAIPELSAAAPAEPTARAAEPPETAPPGAPRGD